MKDSVLMAVVGDELAGIQWPDAELNGISADYDVVTFYLRESSGRRVQVRCVGHIGLCVEGFWDETVIGDADIVSSHPFGERCVASLNERLGAPLPPTGSPARDSGSFETLVITLSDNARIFCCASEFETVIAGE